MTCKYTLYKNPIDLDTLAMVRYLYANSVVLLPTVIIERKHPEKIVLPAIYEYETNQLYEGIDECVRFYESKSGMSNLLDLAHAFAHSNPNYRISEN